MPPQLIQPQWLPLSFSLCTCLPLLASKRNRGGPNHMTAKQMRVSSLLLFHAYMQSHSFSISNLVLAVPSTEILEWITDLYTSQTLYINETHTHISKTEFVTSFLDVNISDFDLYIPKKYLFICLLMLCIPILWGPALQCSASRKYRFT